MVPVFFSLGDRLETFKTLNDLVRTGKIRYIGVSNVTGWQLQKICDLVQRLNLESVVTLQTQYSLLSRGIEMELTDVCENEGQGEQVAQGQYVVSDTCRPALHDYELK